MSGIQSLLAEIQHFRTIVPMAETTFGRLAVNDGKFVGRLRAGGNVTLSVADRVRQFMTERMAAASINENGPRSGEAA